MKLVPVNQCSSLQLSTDSLRQRDGASLVQAYVDAFEIKPTYDDFVAKLAQKCGGVFHRATIKHPFRAVEKANSMRFMQQSDNRPRVAEVLGQSGSDSRVECAGCCAGAHRS